MKRLVLALCAILIFWSDAAAFAEEKQAQGTSEKSKKWSFFFDAFHKDFRPSIGMRGFDLGTAVYSTDQKLWRFTRVEAFIKLRWAVGKYLEPYFTFAIDSTMLEYQLSQFDIGESLLSLKIKLNSYGSPSFGGGLKFFLISWKNLSFHGYLNAQITASNAARLESASMTLNDLNLDLLSAVVDHIDINYSLQRYDVGGILSYKPWSWLTLSAIAGYIWFNSDIRISMDEELAGTIRDLTNINPREVVPKRLTVEESSGFGLLDLKIKLYRYLHLNVTGTIIPSSHPIYYLLTSFSIESEN